MKELEERVARTLQGSVEKKVNTTGDGSPRYFEESAKKNSQYNEQWKEVKPQNRLQVPRICDTGGRRL